MRQAGHDVLYIAETNSGVTDEGVILMARSERRIILTEDKDFGELVFRGRNNIPGLVLLRLEPASDRKWERLRPVISHADDELTGRFTVVEAQRKRSRPLKDH